MSTNTNAYISLHCFLIIFYISFAISPFIYNSNAPKVYKNYHQKEIKDTIRHFIIPFLYRKELTYYK